MLYWFKCHIAQMDTINVLMDLDLHFGSKYYTHSAYFVVQNSALPDISVLCFIAGNKHRERSSKLSASSMF
jgi:hypothetical protein